MARAKITPGRPIGQPAATTSPAGPILLGCVAVFGLCWIFFALSRSFRLSLGLPVVSGMVDNVSVVVRSTLLQLRTPEHLLGRVSAVNQIFIGSSNGITAWKFPALRELDELT